MSDFFEIKCPDCETILIVSRRDGKVVEVRRDIIEDTTGDRFQDAEIKIRREKDTIAKKFEDAKERERTKMDRLNALFEDGLKKAKEDGPIEKPYNPLDAD